MEMRANGMVQCFGRWYRWARMGSTRHLSPQRNLPTLSTPPITATKPSSSLPSPQQQQNKKKQIGPTRIIFGSFYFLAPSTTKRKKNPQGWFYYGQTHRVFNLSSLPAPSFPPTALFVFFVPRVQGSSAYDRATGVSITSRQ